MIQEAEMLDFFWHFKQANWHLKQYEYYKSIYGYRCSECVWHRKQNKYHLANVKFSKLISYTIQKKSKHIVQNITQNNALLNRLQNKLI